MLLGLEGGLVSNPSGSTPLSTVSLGDGSQRRRSLGEMDEEAQLQELGWSPATLVNFVENASTSLHWVGLDGTILWANREELSTLGYTADEYIGHSIVDFHGDKVRIHDILRRLLAGETLRDIPAQMIHKDGSIVQVRMDSSACFDETGAFSHTRCFTHNMTPGRLEASERQKLAAYTKASDSLALARRLQGVNERLRREADMNEALLHQMLPPKAPRPIISQAQASWTAPSRRCGRSQSACRGSRAGSCGGRSTRTFMTLKLRRVPSSWHTFFQHQRRSRWNLASSITIGNT